MKRRASASPDSSRTTKRSAPSSPEEGQLDDPTPRSTSTLAPGSSSLPPRPKVSYPFKKKVNDQPRRHEHYSTRSRSRSRTPSPRRHHRLSPRSPRRDYNRPGQRDRWKGDSWRPEDDLRDRYHSRDDYRDRNEYRDDHYRPRYWDRDRDYDRHSRDYDRPRYRSPRGHYRPSSPPRLHPHSSRLPSPPPCPPSSPPPQPATPPPPPPPPDSISLKRPGAPKETRSPPSLSTVIRQPLEDSIPQTPKGSELPKFRLPKRAPIQRTRKQEEEVYGRVFKGCGSQSDYEITTKLGEGTFGEVHKALQKSTHRSVALKRILMHNEKEGMPVTALREIKILKALKHPCIVEILDMFIVRSTDKDPLSVYMVFPYMDHDLAGLLENERVKLQPSHIKLYMKQLLEGTDYMHRNHILHRDMKAANLLISNDGSLKIADFGLARSFDKDATKGGSDHRGKDRRYTNCVVTRWYRPPELLLGARLYGGEVDLWGIGCVFGEMFLRRPILPGNSDLDQLEKIWQLCGTPNQHTWPHFDSLPGCDGVKRFNPQGRRINKVFHSVGPDTVDLLEKLLTCNPKERYTASQALDHDYFWTDPLPADPKTLPSYEASHEYDKRSQRLQQQQHHQIPPLQHHAPPQPPPMQPPIHIRPGALPAYGLHRGPPNQPNSRLSARGESQNSMNRPPHLPARPAMPQGRTQRPGGRPEPNPSEVLHYG